MCTFTLHVHYISYPVDVPCAHQINFTSAPSGPIPIKCPSPDTTLPQACESQACFNCLPDDSGQEHASFAVLFMFCCFGFTSE